MLGATPDLALRKLLSLQISRKTSDMNPSSPILAQEIGVAKGWPDGGQTVVRWWSNGGQKDFVSGPESHLSQRLRDGLLAFLTCCDPHCFFRHMRSEVH
jgi:hypothetical protein